MRTGDPARGGILRSLALVPGAALAFLPSATCPACIAAYAGVLSAAGLGFVFDARYQTPLISLFLAIGIASIGWSTRSHGRLGPLLITLAGSAGVVAGRLLWSLPALLHAGAVLLFVAAAWNLWLKRSLPEPLVQLKLRSRDIRGSP